MPVPADAPPTISLSDEERKSGILTDVHMYDAVTGFFRDGVVVLENAISPEVIDKLNARMKVDTEKILSGAIKGIHWNQGIERGNVSQVPPMEEEYLDPEIYANRPAAAVMTNLMGPNPELRYVRSNTLIGHTKERQRVHKDLKGRHLGHPCALALNICLVDTTPENGSTELWLGSQSTMNFDDYEDPSLKLGWVKQESLEERRKVRPPVYATLKKGALVLRDLRLWHAGMPNATDETRIMLAFVYTAGWYKNHLRPFWPKELEPTIKKLAAHNNTHIPGEYVDSGKDYLAWQFDGDFGSSLAVH